MSFYSVESDRKLVQGYVSVVEQTEITVVIRSMLVSPDLNGGHAFGYQCLVTQKGDTVIVSDPQLDRGHIYIYRKDTEPNIYKNCGVLNIFDHGINFGHKLLMSQDEKYVAAFYEIPDETKVEKRLNIRFINLQDIYGMLVIVDIKQSSIFEILNLVHVSDDGTSVTLNVKLTENSEPENVDLVLHRSGKWMLLSNENISKVAL